MTDSKEREDFELFVLSKYPGASLAPRVNNRGITCEDSYANPKLDFAYEAWQARANKVAVPPPGFDSIVWVRQKAFNALIKALHIADRKSIWTDDLDDAWDAFDFSLQSVKS